MSKSIINIGIPSKGRLRKDILKIFKKNKLNLVSERGERDLIGSIKQLKNIKVLKGFCKRIRVITLYRRILCLINILITKNTKQILEQK